MKLRMRFSTSILRARLVLGLVGFIAIASPWTSVRSSAIAQCYWLIDWPACDYITVVVPGAIDCCTTPTGNFCCYARFATNNNTKIPDTAPTGTAGNVAYSKRTLNNGCSMSLPVTGSCPTCWYGPFSQYPCDVYILSGAGCTG